MKMSTRGILLIPIAGLLTACFELGETITYDVAEDKTAPAAKTENQEGSSSRMEQIVMGPATSGDFSYAAYDNLLKAYVNDRGYVDYKGMQAGRAPLDTFIAGLAEVEAADFEKWSGDAQLSFWLNAYNAVTLRYILDAYPIEKGSLIAGLRYPANSIRQISGVWDKRTTGILGKETTLDAIEHDIIRVKFNEPRIHFAVVCAAAGCPPLRNEAYVAERLDQQLDAQVSGFLANPEKFRIDRDKSRVYFSSILDWYGKDFLSAYGTDDKFSGHGKVERAVLNFLSRYLGEEDARYLADEKYSIHYLDYDWSLNEQ